MDDKDEDQKIKTCKKKKSRRSRRKKVPIKPDQSKSDVSVNNKKNNDTTIVIDHELDDLIHKFKHLEIKYSTNINVKQSPEKNNGSNGMNESGDASESNNSEREHRTENNASLNPVDEGSDNVHSVGLLNNPGQNIDSTASEIEQKLKIDKQRIFEQINLRNRRRCPDLFTKAQHFMEWKGYVTPDGQLVEQAHRDMLFQKCGPIGTILPLKSYRRYQKHDHLLEMCDFPPETADWWVRGFFNCFQHRGFHMKWVHDTSVLLIFNSSKSADLALEILEDHGAFTLLPFCYASPEARAVAERFPQIVRPACPLYY